MFEFLIGPTIIPNFGSALPNRTKAHQRRDMDIVFDYLSKLHRQNELAQMFRDQFVDDVAGQRAGFMPRP